MRRRRSLRIAVLLVLLFAVTARAVYGAFEACGDPVLDMGGVIVSISVEVPEELVPLIGAEHPFAVVVTVPPHLLGSTSRMDPCPLYVAEIRAGEDEEHMWVAVDAPDLEGVDLYEIYLHIDISALGIHESQSGKSDEWVTKQIQILSGSEWVD